MLESEALVGARRNRSASFALFAVLLLIVGLFSPSQKANAAVPTDIAIDPTFGPVAGNTEVTITGALGTPTGLSIGVDSLSKVADNTVKGDLLEGEWSFQTGTGEIFAKTPERSGEALVVGAQDVTVSNADGDSTDDVLFTYRPAFEDPNLVKVVLGDLASRSQGEPVTRTTTEPYTVSGIDSLSGEPYSYTTDFNYNPSSRSAYYRESVETSASLTTNDDQSTLAEEVLFSSGSCSHNNQSPSGARAAPDGATQAYCSAFGPEVYTEAFFARSTQSLAFQWKASGGGDDYEVYAFLVSVDNDSAIPTPSTSNHTILAHGMGNQQTSYKTAAAAIPADGLYRFRFVNGTYDASGGKAIGAKMFIKRNLTVGLSNVISFPQPSDQVASDDDTYSDITVSLSTTSGGEVEVGESGKCTVTTSFTAPTTTVTISNSGGAGDCVLTATTGAEGEYAPAPDLTRSFEYLPEPEAPGAPTILAVTGGAGNVSVAFSAPNRNGGASISDYQYSTDGTNYTSSGQTSSPLVISGLEFGQNYSVTLKAVNSEGAGAASNAVSGGPTSAAAPSGPSGGSSGDEDGDETPQKLVPSASPGQPGQPLARQGVTPPQANLPVTRQGPVLRNGVVPRDVRAPEVRIGGQATPVQSTVTDPSNLRVRAGVVSLGVRVQQDEGSVSESDDGTTEIAVRKGAKTTLSGEGLRPESTVQVFLPLQGANAKELTRIPVGPDGSFSGDAVFATQPDEDPLPVGRQVLQLVSVDGDGNEVVVDMTVNIAQPPPAPELNRVEGVIPTLTPGSSIATNAGVPEQVRVSAVEEQKLAVVEGDGWSMAIGVAAEDGGVQATDGGASLTLVRNESARVSGDGFMPGTRADVWLFSEPTLLGTVTIDDEGRFDGEVNIDGRVIAVGNHTLQLQGVGEDGYVRAANMGVTVGDPAEVVPTAEENSVMFIWWVLAALVLIALVIVFWIAANRRRSA